ncbi:hypothetical protein K457DRAFT_124138 [Linnemannia elongata AG-77]|uniref:Uncharacterized protein n=1 Tax=Linnemannia elongata AG-77 TaxID=1314771 RepID=A0A197K482_9FUNG|nr:hypothetical protein K457DRAFT_124138 [Linnemannia elongata AG-77]
MESPLLPPPPPPSYIFPTWSLITPPDFPGTKPPTYMTTSRPVPTTDVAPTTIAGNGGGGENTPDPAKPTTPPPSSLPAYSTTDTPRPTFIGSGSTSNPANGGSIATTSTPGGGGGGAGAISGGSITLRPGAPTIYRNNAAETNSPAISGAVISSPMTGVVFTFAFLGALLIGLVAGFLITKYTRLGGREGENEQKDELTEQLRLLTDSLDQQNQQLIQRYQDQHHHQHWSYLTEEKLAHAATNQAEFLP